MNIYITFDCFHTKLGMVDSDSYRRNDALNTIRVSLYSQLTEKGHRVVSDMYEAYEGYSRTNAALHFHEIQDADYVIAFHETAAFGIALALGKRVLWYGEVDGDALFRDHESVTCNLEAQQLLADAGVR